MFPSKNGVLEYDGPIQKFHYNSLRHEDWPQFQAKISKLVILRVSDSECDGMCHLILQALKEVYSSNQHNDPELTPELKSIAEKLQIPMNQITNPALTRLDTEFIVISLKTSWDLRMCVGEGRCPNPNKAVTGSDGKQAQELFHLEFYRNGIRQKVTWFDQINTMQAYQPY